jgi:hypothetical protein
MKKAILILGLFASGIASSQTILFAETDAVASIHRNIQVMEAVKPAPEFRLALLKEVLPDDLYIELRQGMFYEQEVAYNRRKDLCAEIFSKLDDPRFVKCIQSR